MHAKDSKNDLRQALEAQMQAFMDAGGNVKCIPKGNTGRDPKDSHSLTGATLFTTPKKPRTFVPDVVAELDNRRNTKRANRTVNAPKPTRVAIYDDFGEIVRWVWRDQ